MGDLNIGPDPESRTAYSTKLRHSTIPAGKLHGTIPAESSKTNAHFRATTLDSLALIPATQQGLHLSTIWTARLDEALPLVPFSN